MGELATGVDRTVAHSARMWNYYLGGKDNYQVDRDIAEAILAIYPGYAIKARTCRYFLFRAVRFLAVEKACDSSWTSVRGCRPRRTHTRSRSSSRPNRASSTSTTTRWFWPMPGAC